METSYCAYMFQALEKSSLFKSEHQNDYIQCTNKTFVTLLTRREPFLTFTFVFALYYDFFELCVYLNNSPVGWIYIV